MTELEQKIIYRAKAYSHRLYQHDRKHLERILAYPEGAELTDSDRVFLVVLGKEFGLVPKTQLEIESDQRKRQRGYPLLGALKRQRRRRRF